MRPHLDEAAAVVAQVEHQFTTPASASAWNACPGRHRRADEVAEEEVADALAIDVEHASATPSEW